MGGAEAGGTQAAGGMGSGNLGMAQNVSAGGSVGGVTSSNKYFTSSNWTS